MLIQYPHIASVFGTGQGVRNENTGDWVAGDPESALTFKCRAEPQAGNGVIENKDGSVINFNWILYCPLDTPTLLIGTTIIIYGLTQGTDMVKRFSKGQLNTRIWL